MVITPKTIMIINIPDAIKTMIERVNANQPQKSSSNLCTLYPLVKIVIVPKTANKTGDANIIRRIQYIVSDQSSFI